MSPYGATKRVRNVNKRKFNTHKCKVLCSGIRNQMHKYEMENNWQGSSIIKRTWRACGLQNGLFKKEIKKQASIVGSISDNVLYIKPSSMYYIKEEVIILLCSVLSFGLNTMFIRQRKAKESPGKNNWRSGVKEDAPLKKIAFYFPPRQRLNGSKQEKT